MSAVTHLVAALFASAQTPAPIQQGPLTIDQVAAIAEQNAFAVRIQQTRVEKQRENINENSGSMGPKLSVTGTYQRYGEATTANFNNTAIVIQPIESKSVTASASIPIDIAGNLRRLVDASRAGYRAQKSTLRASIDDARLTARQAFLNVLRAQDLVTVQNQALVDAKERLSQEQKLFEQQQVAHVDVTRFEAQVAQSESDLLTAQNSLVVAQQTLNAALARPIETPVQVVGITDLPPLPSDANVLVGVAQQKRPEVQAQLQNLVSLANLRRYQESGMNPSLSFSLNTQYNPDASGLGSASQSTYGLLSLTLPLFDSGVTRAKVKEARQDEVQAKIQLEQIRLGISQDVRSAIANLATAKAKLQSSSEQVRLAEEVYRLAKIRSDVGQGTYVEVIDAETQLTSARDQVVSARYDYLTSFSQLQRSVGVDDIASIAQSTGASSPATGGK